MIMRNLQKLFLLLFLISATSFVFAQKTLEGTVTAADDGNGIPGVSVSVKGTTAGTLTDANGKYKFEAPAGAKFLIFSYIGMTTQEVAINGNKIDVSMEASDIGLTEIYIVADRAKERETPVAFSNIEKKEIEEQLGSRDIPLVMNSTPSVYATAGGGGSGDARINVRGFNQRNVAIMLNGVPINDMENGWVYWSNWDGISDATSSIQMQRGLSAVNLATPSVGGTMNIITSPAEQKAGGVAKFEYGSGNFMKAALTGHSGMINDKFAASASVVRKTGTGVIDGTWTDAWAYYFGATLKLNKKHKLELFALGAPQRHGQNLYKQNVAAYSHEFATELGADAATLDTYPEANAAEQYPGYDDARSGRYYNENWGPVSESYEGQQVVGDKKFDRHSSKFLNERENFYHKPLVNLNWYAKWTPKVSQYTVLYYSGGQGGGTGTYGSMKYNYHAGIPSPSRFVNWDKTIENNMESDTAFGILRNSRNNQNTVGAISKFKILFSDNFKAQVGIDWRTAKIEHYREVRDLLGGQFFYNTSNQFDSGTDYNKVLGDRIAYNFTNTVDWVGYFAQAEYSTKQITAYGMFGHSFIGYTYTNHFKKAEGTENELFAETDMMQGYQIKGGVSYRPFDGFSAFANYGYISKAPIFDNAIDDYSGAVAATPKNEIFNAYEIGINYQTDSKNLDMKLNYYDTQWSDRSISRGIQDEAGNDAIVFLTGMGQHHKGFELEIYYKPINFIEIGAVASFGNWTYTNDVSGQYRSYQNDGTFTDEDYNYYIKDLKVGDAPQTQYVGMITVKPIKGMRIQLNARYYTNHYADFQPTSRTDETDRDQVWLTPAYFLMDTHFSYELPLKGKFGVTIFAHVFNLLDEMYIQDAVDNSRYNGYYGDNNQFSHTVNSAEVYLGLPRTFNAGVKFRF